MKKILIALVVLLCGCAAQKPSQNLSVETPEAHLELGYKHLSNGSAKKAVAEFDKAVALCDSQYQNTNQRVYASRGTTETLFYMLKASVDGENSIAVAPTCADALYLKGYAVLDLGEIEKAEEYITRAIEMSPVNSMYLSELGHLFHVKRDWQGALEVFTRAEESANTYSPEAVKNAELSRAKRGVGYSLIELGRFDEAEVKYKECLEIDPNDKSARNELEYIKKKREDSKSSL